MRVAETVSYCKNIDVKKNIVRQSVLKGALGMITTIL